ncbi:outer membrane beta-barrel protein [Edaphobacter modestus]|uniref:Putative OmpL-like beta-barrel porin-2 n=1 Tax=Edaphobacter modestus TaxID=388466 RepID=A0A4Q7YWS4_9BACT|nr:outer membrane beta-barrel protein [Edaphobacter modestus]RZU41641.1 putative OmpL-like beta-barrel porin-2 [Edaphobacter modestus]
MKTSNKSGSTRTACLSFFLACSATAALAQSGSSEAIQIASTENRSAGILYKVPGMSDSLAGDAQSDAANHTTPSGNFFQRLGGYYKADWTGKLPSSSSPRRMLDAPLDSPPFPSSDWGYGGSPAIGVPDGNVYPLMTALGKQNSRTKIYGWIAASVNGSTSSKSNYPLSYDVYPNSVVLNQAVIYLERLPNTVQKEHFDWGYHLTAFFGNDYRFTTAKDYFSQQLLQKNRRYGFDPVLEYLDLYFPVKEGLNIRIGRFLSVPGIEAQLAPNNYNMSHSLLYTIDPFTDTGAIATLKLTKQWMVQLGISAGHDVAPWSDDAKPSAIACLNYSTKTNHDNFYACANGINDGKYAYNNLQHYDATWYHKFNAKWHMATEAWYMYQREVPNVAGNVENPVPTEIGANGAYCAPGQLTCTAPEYAVVNYVNREFNPHLFVGFRSDLLNDKKGQRTGIPGKYTENTLYATKYFGSTILVRPEIRFDHSWDRPGYNNGTARNQFFFGVDMIYKF